MKKARYCCVDWIDSNISRNFVFEKVSFFRFPDLREFFVKNGLFFGPFLTVLCKKLPETRVVVLEVTGYLFPKKCKIL